MKFRVIRIGLRSTVITFISAGIAFSPLLEKTYGSSQAGSQKKSWRWNHDAAVTCLSVNIAAGRNKVTVLLSTTGKTGVNQINLCRNERPFPSGLAFIERFAPQFVFFFFSWLAIRYSLLVSRSPFSIYQSSFVSQQLIFSQQKGLRPAIEILTQVTFIFRNAPVHLQSR